MILGNRINKLVLSNFMGIVSSVSVIFDTGATHSCSSNKGEFVKLEEKKSPRKLKGIAKGLEIFGFGIVEYSVRSESGRMIALRVQAYCVPGLPEDLRIIYQQGICTMLFCRELGKCSCRKGSTDEYLVIYYN